MSETFEACPLCETEGCVWCDGTGLVKHECPEASDLWYAHDGGVRTTAWSGTSTTR